MTASKTERPSICTTAIVGGAASRDARFQDARNAIPFGSKS